MPVILVANSKGGVGKSTVASNLAGFYARHGERTMLGDLDRQQSVIRWLKLRPQDAPSIASWDFSANGVARPPDGVTHIVLDAPAGVPGEALKKTIKLGVKVIVPCQASLFDIEATHAFLGELTQYGATIANGSVALVGMRVDARTRASSWLERYVRENHVPFLGFLRDTQLYVQLAARGLTIWDVAPSRVERDIEQWTPIIRWIGSGRLTDD